MMSRRILLLSFAGLVLGVSAVSACLVPVYRYAIERWAADRYHAVLFHRGPLTPEQRALADELDGDRGGSGAVELLTVDLAEKVPEALQDLWDAQQGPTLPWLVVRTAPTVKKQPQIYAATLSRDVVRAVLHSPARKEIARNILRGDSAVWVLLESGNKDQDDAAAQFLGEQLREMEKTLKLPVLRENNPEDRIERGPNAPPLKIAFSMLRLSRTNAAEQPLVQMLMNVEPDLSEYRDKPMVFPIFGRGRARPPLIGKGINKDVINEECGFLIGACTCEQKGANLGHDLLLATDWEAEIQKWRDDKAPAIKSRPKKSPTTTPQTSRTSPAEETTAPTEEPEPPPSSGLGWLFLVLLAGVAGTAAVGLFLGRLPRR